MGQGDGGKRPTLAESLDKLADDAERALEDARGELDLRRAEHQLISAGYDPEFFRWGCTLKDFKAFLLVTMQERLERQRELSMAMSLALGSLFDPKVGKDASQAMQRAIQAIVEQQEGLYGLKEFAETGQRTPRITREQKKQEENKRDDSGLTKKEIKTWKDAGKIDILMAKMTGRPTGAIWSNINDGSLQMDGSDLSGRVDAQTGEQIVSKMRGFHERMRGSVRAGPRRRK